MTRRRFLTALTAALAAVPLILRGRRKAEAEPDQNRLVRLTIYGCDRGMMTEAEAQRIIAAENPKSYWIWSEPGSRTQGGYGAIRWRAA